MTDRNRCFCRDVGRFLPLDVIHPQSLQAQEPRHWQTRGGQIIRLMLSNYQLELLGLRCPQVAGFEVSGDTGTVCDAGCLPECIAKAMVHVQEA